MSDEIEFWEEEIDTIKRLLRSADGDEARQLRRDLGVRQRRIAELSDPDYGLRRAIAEMKAPGGIDE